jgi:hypothetical protein
MLTVLNFADGFGFQESASQFVPKPSQKRINVLVSRLKSEYVRVVIIPVCLVGGWLLAILRESEHIVFVSDLFSD